MNEQLLYGRLNSRYLRVSIMSACAPTDNAEEETKDNFYSSLQAVLDDIQRHDITLLMRDFSARVGQYKSDGSTGSRRHHKQRRKAR